MSEFNDFTPDINLLTVLIKTGDLHIDLSHIHHAMMTCHLFLKTGQSPYSKIEPYAMD